MNRFEECLVSVRGSEGGYTKRRSDRGNWTGGEVGKGILKGTKYGISAAAYPDEDIENLTWERAAFLYRRDYWDRCRCGELPYRLDLLVMDSAVNHGWVRAGRFLQETLNRHGAGLAVDGRIGPKTLAAVERAMIEISPRGLLGGYLLTRVEFYAQLLNGNPEEDPDYDYIRGWLLRVARLRDDVGV